MDLLKGEGYSLLPRKDQGSEGGGGSVEDRGSEGGRGPETDRGSEGGQGPETDRGSEGGQGAEADRGSEGGQRAEEDQGSEGGQGSEKAKCPAATPIESAASALLNMPKPAQGAKQSGTVRLLTATRIPAGFSKIVQARVNGGDCSRAEKGLLLFMPGSVLDTDVIIADGAVEAREGTCVELVVENRGHTPVKLKKGTSLGGVKPVTEVSDAELTDALDAELTKELERAMLEMGSSSGDAAQVMAMQAESPADREATLLSQLPLEMDHLTSEEQQQLRQLIGSYSDVFALNPGELGTTGVVSHTIDTGDHPPIRQPLRRTPFALRAKVEEMVREMLDQQVIIPSKSPWASPVVLVRKKDGALRFCVDYRKLNQVTKRDEFPLPRIDDTLELLSGAKHFTTLDLSSGFWQVEMDQSSQEKTAFATFSGLYEFRKMPFGLANSPATFQRLMEIVLAGVARDACFVYIDDIVVFGKTLQDHNDNLVKVLDRLREAGLSLKPKKCRFARQEIEFLGHVVSAKGIATDPRKLEAVIDFPTPVDVKTLRSFLGLASYYRRFIPNFSKVAGALHTLTKKDADFIWTPECQLAFDGLKRLLTTSPVLAFPDFSKPFLLETDASGTGLGAVLAQTQEDGTVRPIAYASRTLQKHERNYGVTELEGLGVVWAVKHFRPYIYGHPCEIYTDHEALKSILNTPQPSGKLARWGMAIQELDLKILHRSGRHNANADALSRSPVSSPDSEQCGMPFGIVSAITVTGEESDLPALQRGDAELAPVIRYLESGTLPEDAKLAKALALNKSQYVLQDGILYHMESDSTLRVIPPTSARAQLFQQAHAGRFGGHLGDAKVHSELRRHYWWPKMRTDITQWTRGCLVCASHNPGRAVRAPLTPIPVGGPFDRIGVDVIQFPRSEAGNQYAVVFVDYLTKWPEVFAVADQSAATIARLLVEQIVSRHGVPSEVLSDRGKAFLSGLMGEVEKLLGFHKVNTSAYHPQTDGLVERFNRTLTAMLAKTLERGGQDWDTHLPFVLFAYRATQQESTQESPFFLLYGRDPRLPVEEVLSPLQTKTLVDLREYGADLAHKMSGAWESARENVKKAQRRQKNCYDRGKRPPNFAVGERVFLFKPAEKTGKRRKFARPFHGPYRVVELDVNDAKIRRVDRPQDETILVALDRLRRCPDEVQDEFWPPSKAEVKKKADSGKSAPQRESPDGQGPSPEVPPPVKEMSSKSVEQGSSFEGTPAVEKTSSKSSPIQAKVASGKWAGRLRRHPRTADS